MNPGPCPSCGLVDDWKENPIKPYCSEVCRLLWRHGLAWRIQPYRVVIGTHPHLIVQSGPRFDLRESALLGAKQRALEADRKHRQRATAKVRNVPSTEQYKPSIQGSFSILGVQDQPEVINYGK
jgi:hypothetical protein